MASSSLHPSPPPPPPSQDTAAPPPPPSNIFQEVEENQHADTLTTFPTRETDHQYQEKSNPPNSSKNYKLLLALSYGLIFIGSVSSSLISKYYFIHNGSSRWVSTWVQSAGFPLLIPPIYAPYYLLESTKRKPFSRFDRKILLLSILIGVLLGVNNLLFSWGTSYLPVSTSSLVLSSQLAFNLILSMIIVGQKVNFMNLNCVVLLTLSSVLLALGASRDRPAGLTHRKYLVGFFSTLGAGLLFALYLPIMEMVYRKVYCYAMVVEMQLVMEIVATAFATVGMAADGGFSDMKYEAATIFDKGPAAYWLTIAGNLVFWQFCFLGTAGMVFLTTSLTGGICMTALLAINVVGGVVVYGDAFGGVKVVATVLCVWGFCSYLFGMYVRNQKLEKSDEAVEMNEILTNSQGHM